MTDIATFFIARGRADLAEHSGRVALEAVRLSKQVGLDAGQAEAAGWLHDLGVLVPPEAQVAEARRFGLEPLPEELQLPFLLHQRLSAELARHLFGITDAAVLTAINCHTTLRPGAATLDKVLFVADKRSWDAADRLPGADAPLDEAVPALLRALRGSRLQVVHPWLRAAYEEATGTSWDGAHHM